MPSWPPTLLVGSQDNIDVAGLPTTAACQEFEYVPGEHARAVQPLLDAGKACKRRAVCSSGGSAPQALPVHSHGQVWEPMSTHAAGAADGSCCCLAISSEARRPC